MAESEVVVNPFTSLATAGPQTALAQSDAQRSIAEVQAALMIARMNPRDPKRAMDLILQDCTRESLAEKAVYAFARGGSDISGPSIRLAEVLAQRWGNIQYGVRELEQREGESVVQAYAWDVESNTRREMTFTAAHVRESRRSGQQAITGARDIYEVTANQGARRVRACILGIIPGDVVEAALRQCEVTASAKADVTPERIAEMLKFFATFKVTKEMVEKRIQRRVEAITPALFLQLGKIANSLRDNMSAAGDWFEMAPAIKEVLRKSDSAQAPATATESPADPAPEPEPLPDAGATFDPDASYRLRRVWQPNPQKPYYFLETDGGLTLHTWSTTVVASAKAALDSELPVRLTADKANFAPAPWRVTALAPSDRELGEEG